MQNLGLVGVKSIYGTYLQAHDDDGEMHASNQNRNEEETWFLIQVDTHIFALQNWRNGKYLSIKDNNCACADSVVLSPTEQWIIINGSELKIANAIAIKSAMRNRYLGTNPPSHDCGCGGEVSATDPGTPQSNPKWPCWWVLESATPPSAGTDAWNVLEGVFKGIANQITPADIAAAFALFA